jgi:N-acetylglucosamine malate deacetylase 2
MDYLDPVVGPGDELFPFTSDLEDLAQQVVSAMEETQCDVLLCHGINGEYGHPAHKLAHQAAALAISRRGAQSPLFYTIMGSFPNNPYPRLMNADAPAHFVLDIQPFLPQKTQAAACHRTQHALFVRHRSEELGRPLTIPEVILPIESLTRVWPSVEPGSQPTDVLADLLIQSGLLMRG